jgi:hypothetical protein
MYGVFMLKFIVAVMLLCMPILAQATPEQVWQASMALAQRGDDAKAIALLHGAQLQSTKKANAANVWNQRFDIAIRMLDLRQRAKHQSDYRSLQLSGSNQYELLMKQWLTQHPLPEVQDSFLPGLLASIIPGSGHAWLGRWHDALTAALLVVPMLLLSIWAWRRAMGPVTVFFSLITLWLWSGTVFSALSLAERANYLTYITWWQSLWLGAALPGHVPW